MDDDEVDRQAITRALRHAGVQADVIEASTMVEAEASVTSGVGCVLLDYHLPGTTGLEALASVRLLDQLVPVIALTGQGDEQIAVAMLKAGAIDYLSKQALTPDRLERSIRHALRDAEAARERAALLQRAERARAEAEEANRAKDEFLAMLSHELRTPLNTILGWARMLTPAQADPAVLHRGLKTIERNALLQVKLIDDLLEISRIITGKLTIDHAPVELSAVLATVVESMQPLAKAGSVTLTLRLEGEERHVSGDAPRLQQVISNLVSNALKFTPVGGRIEVGLSFTRDAARLVVSDTGAGITPEFLPRVFDRFRQGDASSTRKHGGLGLGLSIVRHLVEAHGGLVTAQSDGPDRGATFTVTLPVLCEAVAPLRLEAASLKGSIQGLCILLVEDDDDNRDLTGRMLEGAGAVVVTAGSVREAMASLASFRPDVVVTDIAMPDEDGYALMDQLRGSPAPMPPVVAFTAFAGDEDRVRTTTAGFDAHVAKPGDLGHLVSAISAVVTSRRDPTSGCAVRS